MKNITVPLYLIVIVVAIPQLSETIYVPALPMLARELSISSSLAELTLTTYLIGFGFGVLIWGAMSDQYGRKPIFLLGFIIYVISSIACFYATNIEGMFLFRFIQAFGASVGSVLGQAVARDAIRPEDRGRMFSMVSMAMAFAPAIGPMIGSSVIAASRWQYVFLVLAIIGIFAILLLILKLPETRVKSNKNEGGIMASYRACIAQMVADKEILGYGFMVGSVNGILFGYFAESPFYFLEAFGLSNHLFGYLALFICIPLFVGSALSKFLLQAGNNNLKLIKGGILVIILGNIIYYSLSLSGYLSISTPYSSVAISIIFIAITVTGVAIIIPNCLSAALQNYGHFTGTASSIFGFYYYSVVAAMTSLMSILHDGTIIQLPLFFLLQGVLMMVVYQLTLQKKPIMIKR